MTAFFANVVDRGITAGFLVLLVVLLRLVLRKAPKWTHVLLWGLVALRLACDERVVRDQPMAERAAYAEALLACSVGNKNVRHIGRLAFGEVGVHTRIRSVLRYRKPALWIVGSALFVCIAAALCFLTDPVGSVYDHEWYFVQSTTTLHDSGKTTVCYQPGQTSPDDDAEAIDTVLIPHTEAMWYELISGTWDIDRATLHILPDEEDPTRYTVEWYDDHDTFITVGEAVLEQKNLLSKAYTLTMHCVSDATTLDMVFTTEAPPALPSGEKTLTLADVTALTDRRIARHTALTWDDLADYRYTDVGVGQFVCRYPIEDTYTLVATGGSMVGEPMSIRLYKGEKSVDIQRKPFRGFADDIR